MTNYFRLVVVLVFITLSNADNYKPPCPKSPGVYNGINGRNGADGPQGPVGPRGLAGPRGQQGIPGTSTGGRIYFAARFLGIGKLTHLRPFAIGFGNAIQITINGSGQSTDPTELDGQGFIVPFNNSAITDLEVGCIAHFINNSTVSAANPLVYRFMVLIMRCISNNGIDQPSRMYVETGLTQTISFGLGGPIPIPSYRAVSNFFEGTLNTKAGDRIALRISPDLPDNGRIDIDIASFTASFTYKQTL